MLASPAPRAGLPATGEGALAGLRAIAANREIHRPHPYDHAIDTGVARVRAGDVRADAESGDRQAVHVRAGRLRGNGVSPDHRSVRHPARSAGALGAGVSGDRRAATHVRGAAAGGDLDRGLGAAARGVSSPDPRPSGMGKAQRADSGGGRGDEPLDTDTTAALEGESWLMHHGYTQAEGVAHLDQVPETGCLVTIGYPKFGGGVGGFARYVAICPPEWGQGMRIGEVPEAPLQKSNTPLRWDSAAGMRVRR